MFRIEYKIITEQLEEIEYISDEEIQYAFLLGNVSFFSFKSGIEMAWEWIPLLDFAYCLKEIVRKLNGSTTKEYFEFTENSETLVFSRCRKQLKIIASFSPTMIETTFSNFEKAVYDFHFSISGYIRRNISGELPSVLQKYLSVEV